MAAPAVRIAVLVVQLAEQQAAGGQVLDQGLVGGLEELAADQPDLGVERPVGTDRVHHRQPVGPAAEHVVLAERGRLVHQAGAVLGGDVVGQDHVVGAAFGGREVDQLEGTLVAPALHLGAGEGLPQRPLLAEHLLGQRLGHHQRVLTLARHHVGDLGVGGDGGVGDQRPGRGGPDQQVGRAREGARGEREPDVDRRVDDVLVALGELVVGQGGAAARAVRRDAVVLDQQPLVVDLLQRPPHRLHVLGRHGPVGVFEVDPVAHPFGQRGPLVDVTGHRGAAAVVELLDAVRLDVGLAGEAELLLHRQLDGQAVAVPAGLAVDVEALHRLEAGEDVLERARLDVGRAGHAVGGGRAFVERPARRAVGLGQGRLEGLVLLPEGEHIVLHRRQIDLRRDCVVPGLGGHLILFVERRDEGTRPRPRGTTLLGRRGAPLACSPQPVLVSPRAVLPAARG